MELIPDIAERVTAITDFMMAIAAAIGIVQFRRMTILSPWKINLWTAIYLLFIFAAVVGTVHHGLALSPRYYDLSWLGILLALGIMVGLFVVGLVYDVSGQRAASFALPIMIVVALAFFIYSYTHGQDYSLFLMYEALALISALSGYAYLAFKGNAGALSMTIGVLITIIAAAVQATKAITFTFMWPFDHNANYHLIQIIGVFFLSHGITRSITR